MTSTPIAGNQFFSSVRNQAAPLQHVNAGEVKTSSLLASCISSNLQSTTLPDGRSLCTVLAYAPTGFSTLPDGETLFLNVAPNMPPATSVTDPQLLLLPNGSFIFEYILTNNGVPITGDELDIGTEDFSVTPSGSDNLESGIPVDVLNIGAKVGQPVEELGDEPDPFEIWADPVTNDVTGLSVTAGDPVSTGDMALKIVLLKQ